MNYSDFFKLNWRDVAKGLVVAVLSAAATALYQALNTHTAIDWHVIGGAALTAGIGYLVKNFLSDDRGQVLGAIG